jgi:hypothetical protein
MLLGTPFPACGIPEDTGVANGNAESGLISPSDSEPSVAAGSSDN